MVTSRAEDMGITAIIVTYHPEFEQLRALIDTMSDQTQSLCIVDNSPKRLDDRLVAGADKYIHLADNPGIAVAHNRGIQYAIAQKAKHVILLDQDSQPNVDMVARLLAGINSEAGQAIAAIGPCFRDIKTGDYSSFLQIGYLKNRIWTHKAGAPNCLVDTDALISSGCLIPTEVFETIGFMDETLFIDHVDTEWCMRAKQAGYALKGLCGDLMLHRLGESNRRLWLGRWRTAAIHKSFRYYYIFRNGLELAKRSNSQAKWRLFHIKRLIILLAFIGLAPSRTANLGYAFRGIRDGLRGLSGPIPL